MEQPNTISSVGRSSFEALYSTVNLIRSTNLKEISYDEIDHQRRRFNVWAGNINALIDPRSQSSLDSRLSKAPLVAESVLWNLRRLGDYLQRAQPIIKGEKPNRFIKASDEEEQNGENQTRETTELRELIYGIQSSITQLFRISMIIRQLRPRGRGVKSRNLPPLDPGPDIMHIGDKFSKSRTTPWLMDRLGKAIMERRDFFRQQKWRREEQRAKAAQNVNRQGDEAGFEHNTLVGEDRNTLKATTFQGEDEFITPSNQLDHVYEESVHSQATETSRATSTGGMDDEALRIPDPPHILPNGMKFEYGEPFECPYCLNIQTVENRSQWKSHIFEDLQPYICTFEGCSPTLYSKRHEWFDHELQYHRTQWECIICKSFTFQSEKQLSSHMFGEHGAMTTASQVPVLVAAGRKPQTYFDTNACPLCPNWTSQNSGTNNLAQFRRHLGKHLEQLALSALPKPTTDDQDGDDDDATSEEAMSENAENEEPTNKEVTDEDAEAIKELEKGGFDKWGNDTRNKNREALPWAACSQKWSAVKYLSKRGSDVAKTDKHRKTALHWAARHGNSSVVEMLLAAGAPLEVQDENGETPLHWAAKEGNAKIVTLLLEAGAPLEVQDENGETPLHWAAEQGNARTLTLLLEAGAQVNARCGSNRTPLHSASWCGKAENTELLIRYGADLEAKDNVNETPLHDAAQKNHVSVAQLLLDAGADINAQGNEGTPLQVAIKHSKTEMVEFLKSGGARE